MTPPPNPHAQAAATAIAAHMAQARETTPQRLTPEQIDAMFAACRESSMRRGWAVVDGRRMWTDGVQFVFEGGARACWFEDEPY